MLYIEENKLNGRGKGPYHSIIPFCSKDGPVFKELVIKIALIKKKDRFLSLWNSFTFLRAKSHYE